MKALITGSEGQLAREFSRKFRENGTEFIALTYNDLDISDFAKVRQIVGQYKPEIILNCAAYNAVDKAEEDSSYAFLVNGTGVKNLVLASEEIGSIFVHYSSDYVFDGTKGSPYSTSDKPKPINSYGKSKLLGESSIYESNYSNFYLIRVSWLFGEGEYSFAKKLLSWMSSNDNLKIVDDQVSSPTYTEDLVSSTLELIKTGKYGLYHMSNAEQCSRYEWAKYIAETIGWHGSIKAAKSDDFPSAVKRPSYSVLNNLSLEETIGRGFPYWADATKRFLKREKLI